MKITFFLVLFSALMFQSFDSGKLANNPNFITTNQKEMNKEAVKSIKALLHNYEKALNASDTKAILKLYAEDGVFMPSEAPTSIGKEAVETAYNYVFSQIKLNIVFSIDEIEVHDNFAFARTISKGTTDILAANITVPEENRELFIFKKENGEWKIARYIFNKMSPPTK